MLKQLMQKQIFPNLISAEETKGSNSVSRLLWLKCFVLHLSYSENFLSLVFIGWLKDLLERQKILTNQVVNNVIKIRYTCFEKDWNRQVHGKSNRFFVFLFSFSMISCSWHPCVSSADIKQMIQRYKSVLVEYIQPYVSTKTTCQNIGSLISIISEK